MLYHKQGQLNKVLRREGLTKLSGKKVSLLAIKYIICLLIGKMAHNNKFENPVNTLGISWSPLHYNILKNYLPSEHIYSINSPLSYKDISIVAKFESFWTVFKNTLKYQGENRFAFSLIVTVESMFFRHLLKLKKVKEVCISGHYDRYVCSISEVAKECHTELSVYQHGAVAALSGLPQFQACNIYLQYMISKNTFDSFYICQNYILCEAPDIKRIKNGIGLPEDKLSILFIGQDKSPEFNIQIVTELVRVLSGFEIDYRIYHLKHPRDQYLYNIDGNYEEITTTPRNPDLVFSRYSSLAYAYHILNYSVYFINLDDVDADFMSDSTVNKISLSKLIEMEYLKKNV